MIEADGTAKLIAVLLGAAFLGVLWFGWGVRTFSRPLGYLVMVGAAALLIVHRSVAGSAPAWVEDILAVTIFVVFVGGIGLLVVGGGLQLVGAKGLRHLLRKAARTGLTDETRSHGHATPELEALAAPLEAHGFTRLFVGQRRGVARIMLLRGDGVIAEVASGPDTTPTHPHVVVELTSTLVGRRGLLCTGTSGVRLAGWAGELRQVFPGSEPTHLVDHHEAALRFLHARSIEPDAVDRSDALEAEEWGHRVLATATADASNSELRERARALATRAHLNVGPLAADPDIDRRLDAFWDAVRVQ